MAFLVKRKSISIWKGILHCDLLCISHETSTLSGADPGFSVGGGGGGRLIGENVCKSERNGYVWGGPLYFFCRSVTGYKCDSVFDATSPEEYMLPLFLFSGKKCKRENTQCLSTCLNGGRCRKRRCKCPPTHTGEFCQYGKIMFVCCCFSVGPRCILWGHWYPLFRIGMAAHEFQSQGGSIITCTFSVACTQESLESSLIAGIEYRTRISRF